MAEPDQTQTPASKKAEEFHVPGGRPVRGIFQDHGLRDKHNVVELSFRGYVIGYIITLKYEWEKTEAFSAEYESYATFRRGERSGVELPRRESTLTARRTIAVGTASIIHAIMHTIFSTLNNLAGEFRYLDGYVQRLGSEIERSVLSTLEEIDEERIRVQSPEMAGGRGPAEAAFDLKEDPGNLTGAVLTPPRDNADELIRRLPKEGEVNSGEADPASLAGATITPPQVGTAMELMEAFWKLPREEQDRFLKAQLGTLLTSEQAAEVIGISHVWVKKLAQLGELGTKIGRNYVLTSQETQTYKEKERRPGPKSPGDSK